MQITCVEKKVLSCDKIHNLNGLVYIPSGEVKGIFHIVHGMNEHIGRYDAFMRKIAENGYICAAYDNLGHGKTVNGEDELGYFADKDGFRFLVEDVRNFASEIRKCYGEDLPYYLAGHSMGSFIARCSAAKYPPDKLIIMGTGGENPMAFFGIIILKIIKAVFGGKHASRLAEKIAFGSYNSHFKDENDKYSWLTKDESIRREYAKDSLCTFKFTVSAMEDLMKLVILSNSERWYEKIDKNMPILVISGKDDPVGNYGKGVSAVYDRLRNRGADVKLKLYDNCRHELLNDTCKEETTNDILEFIK